ncbi:MAG: VTT domain-containing protein, partial [Anaerolineales bacterium]
MTQPASEKTFLQRNGQKITALIFWLGLIFLYQWYANTNSLSPLQVVQQLIEFMKKGFWGVFIYIILYAVRPLILFPSTILTLAGGFVFGPVLGVLYTIIASNISSSIAYLVGLFFGEGLVKDDGSDGWAQRYARRMREN